jgi:hypothetical protein
MTPSTVVFLYQLGIVHTYFQIYLTIGQLLA